MSQLLPSSCVSLNSFALSPAERHPVTERVFALLSSSCALPLRANAGAIARKETASRLKVNFVVIGISPCQEASKTDAHLLPDEESVHPEARGDHTANPSTPGRIRVISATRYSGLSRATSTDRMALFEWPRSGIEP